MPKIARLEAVLCRKTPNRITKKQTNPLILNKTVYFSEKSLSFFIIFLFCTSFLRRTRKGLISYFFIKVNNFQRLTVCQIPPLRYHSSKQ